MDQGQHRRLAKADEEITGYYTSAIGVKAQSYETWSAAFDPNAAHLGRLMQMRWLAPRERGKPRPRGELEWFDSVGATLGALDESTRHVIDMIYGFGTGAFAEGDSVVDSAKEEIEDDETVDGRAPPDPLGLLKLAIAPTWGHGSFLRIALVQPRALRAFGKKYPDRTPTPTGVLDFLAFEAGRGQASEKLLAKIRDDCDEHRVRALAEYETLRRERVRADKKRDEDAARDARLAREFRLAKELGMKRRRERARFEARLARRVASP